MVNHGLNFVRVKDPVHSPGLKIVDCDWSCNLVTHDNVDVQYNIFRGWGAPVMGLKNFLCNSFTHGYYFSTTIFERTLNLIPVLT